MLLGIGEVVLTLIKLYAKLPPAFCFVRFDALGILDSEVVDAAGIRAWAVVVFVLTGMIILT